MNCCPPSSPCSSSFTFAYKDKSRVSSAQFSLSPKARHSTTFEVADDGEDDQPQPSLPSRDHQHGDHDELTVGPQTETDKVHEETEGALIPGRDLGFGSKPEQESLPAEQAGRKDGLHEGEVDVAVNPRTEEEELDGAKFTAKEHEEAKEQEHQDRGDGEQREEATEGESALTERSPEADKSLAEASQSHESEAHIDITVSASENGETSEKTNGEERCLTLSANKILIADCELGQLTSQSPTTDKSEQERRDEVLDPSMSRRET